MFNRWRTVVTLVGVALGAIGYVSGQREVLATEPTEALVRPLASVTFVQTAIQPLPAHVSPASRVGSVRWTIGCGVGRTAGGTDSP